MSYDTLQNELDDFDMGSDDGREESSESETVAEESAETEEIVEAEESEEPVMEEVIEGTDDESIDESADESVEEEVEERVAEEVVEPVVSVDTSAIDELKAQNKQLMDMLAKQQEIPQKAEEPEVASAVPTNIQELFAETSFDEILGDQELFVEFMQNVMGMATERSVERVSTTMPQYVMNQIQQQQVLTDASTAFYGANKNLVPHKKIVGMLTNEVIAEHQDWSLEQVLSETADRAHTLLNLKQDAINQDTKVVAPTGGKPALNSKVRGGKKSAPKLTNSNARLTI